MDRVRSTGFFSNSMLRQESPDGNCGLGWHSDWPYSTISDEASGSQSSSGWHRFPLPEYPLGVRVQVLLSLNELTACNGGTLFYTNSHKAGDCSVFSELWANCPADGSHTGMRIAPPWEADGGYIHQCEQLGRQATDEEIDAGFEPHPHIYIMAYHPTPPGTLTIYHSSWCHRQIRNVGSSGAPYPNRRTCLLRGYCAGWVLHPCEVWPEDEGRYDWQSYVDDGVFDSVTITPRDKDVLTQLNRHDKDPHPGDTEWYDPKTSAVPS